MKIIIIIRFRADIPSIDKKIKTKMALIKIYIYLQTRIFQMEIQGLRKDQEHQRSQ